MISRLIAFTLLLALISSHLSTLFVYAEFKSNQKYIAETLCENKDKPQLNCQGKCYLMKKLKDAEEKEKKQEKETQKKAAYDLFFNTKSFHTILAVLLPRWEKPKTSSFDLPQFSAEILQPPQLRLYNSY